MNVIYFFHFIEHFPHHICKILIRLAVEFHVIITDSQGKQGPRLWCGPELTLDRCASCEPCLSTVSPNPPPLSRVSHVCGSSALSALGGKPDTPWFTRCMQTRTHPKSNSLGFRSRRWVTYYLTQHTCETWWNEITLFSFHSAIKVISSRSKSTFHLRPAWKVQTMGQHWLFLRSNHKQM